MLFKISQNRSFIIFRAEDIRSIQPVFGSARQLKYYSLSLLFLDKKICLSVEEANQLAKLLKPIDLTLEAAEIQSQIDTIDILLDSLG